MKLNHVPLFISFWFSLFFLSIALFNSLKPLDSLAIIDNTLVTVLCILCSHEAARLLTNYLLKDE